MQAVGMCRTAWELSGSAEAAGSQTGRGFASGSEQASTSAEGHGQAEEDRGNRGSGGNSSKAWEVGTGVNEMRIIIREFQGERRKVERGGEVRWLGEWAIGRVCCVEDEGSDD